MPILINIEPLDEPPTSNPRLGSALGWVSRRQHLELEQSTSGSCVGSIFGIGEEDPTCIARTPSLWPELEFVDFGSDVQSSDSNTNFDSFSVSPGFPGLESELPDARLSPSQSTIPESEYTMSTHCSPSPRGDSYDLDDHDSGLLADNGPGNFGTRSTASPEL